MRFAAPGEEHGAEHHYERKPGRQQFLRINFSDAIGAAALDAVGPRAAAAHAPSAAVL